MSGLAAALLKSTVHGMQYLLGALYEQDISFYYIAPFVGILATAWFARKVLREQLGHGITQLLYAISKNHAFIKPKRSYSTMLTSTLTVGFGGSVGLEAPIVVTGSAIASNLARWANMGYRTRLLLIGCGSAAAISGIFNSPVAGTLFAIEVILVDVTIFQFIPVLIASVLGAVVAQSLLGDEILFSFTLKDAFEKGDIPFYILLGVLCGFVSLYFMRMGFFVEEWTKRVRKPLKRAVLGGATLAALIALAPPLYGEGYEIITSLLSGEEKVLFSRVIFLDHLTENVGFILSFLALVLLLKPIATAVTIGSGGSGGIFAPSLFVGAMGGYLFARSTNFLFPAAALSTSNFTLAGMSAVMSSLLHAPLTAIFLIAEITDSYEMFIPLMIASAMGYLTISYFERYSFYSKHLIERGDLIPSQNRDERILSQMQLTSLIESDLLSIKPEASLEALVDLVRKSRRNIFPVLREDNSLCGIVTLDDIREIMFETHKHKDVRVEDIMSLPPDTISLDEPMRKIMQRFESTQLWNLPVQHKGKYVGFVSKSRIFNTYRELLLISSNSM